MGNFRKTAFTSIIAAFGVVIFTGCTRSENALDQYNANEEDINFAKAAAVANYTEISLGRLDQQKGVDSAGKDYGDSMVVNHTASNELLKSIANPLGLGTPDTLDTDHQALKAYLNGLSGRSFDSAYIKNMVLDHQAAIALYNDEVSKGQHFALRKFAQNQLPMLQAHLDKATTIAAQY